MIRYRFFAIVLLGLSIFSFPTILSGIIPRANATSPTFTFAASGDFGSLTTSSSVNNLNRLASANPNFFLGLGDLSYSPSVTGDLWCSQFKSGYNNIQIVSGDHDTGGHSQTFGETHNYDTYLSGCPLTVGTTIVCGPIEGDCYGKEYYFDYPAGNPIARFIFAVPKIYNITGVCTSSPNCSSQTNQPCTDQYGCWQYSAGDAHYNWVSNSIDNAHTLGIRWVIVATHKVCISSSDATCSMGNAFFNMLVQKKVDLIIQAHDNAYERSKQLAINPTAGCSSIKNDGNGYAVYNSACIADSGNRGYYTPGVGSVVVAQGAWINDLYGVNASSSNPPNVSEAPYFVKLMGSNTPGNGLGFVQYTVSTNRIDVRTNFSGTFSDSFSIWAGPNPVPALSWSPQSPQVGQLVTFTATASGGVSPYAFAWDFGDGSHATGTTATHNFNSAKYYNVTLTATDSIGNTGSSRSLVPVGSWNGAVPCSPTLTTIENVVGSVPIQRVPSDPTSVGADYSGGGFKLAGNLAFGSSPSNWPFSKRALQPPCNVNGIPTFVELHNVSLTVQPAVATYDCRTAYDVANGAAPFTNGQNCDVVFSVGNPSANNCPSCFMHRIYAEIDGDWNASGTAPPTPPAPGQLIDVQGFVYWDADSLNFSSHNWSGWELHPFTAWRYSQTKPTAPTVTIQNASPNPANTGSTVNLAFTVSGSATVSGITVNWGDGSTLDNLPGTATSDSHVYASTGNFKSQTFTITVTATNSVGSGTGQTTEIVNDRPPVVTITSVVPTTPFVGQPVTVSFSSTDPDGSLASISVDWGDNSPPDTLPGASSSDTHTYSVLGTFQVTVTATDNSGSAGQATTTITDAAQTGPTVTVNSPTPNPATTGSTVTVTFNVSSSSTIKTVTVNWGDGSPIDSLAITATSDTHIYSSTGNAKTQSFLITVTATNNAGPGSGTTTATISDQAPTVTIGGISPNPALTGSPVTVSFASTDPDGSITSFTVAWGDGSSPTTLPGTATSASHTYTNTGNAQSQGFSITVTATDNSGSTGTTGGAVTIDDRPPTISVSNISPNPANTGQAVTITFADADPDGAMSSITINWGDGSPITNLSGTATSATHTYSSTGSVSSQTLTIQLTATDNSGLTGSASGSVVVNDRPPVATVSSPSPNPALTGQTVTVSFSANDPDGTISSFNVNWGDGTTIDSLPGTATSDSHSYLYPGSYTITVTATDNSGSSGSASTSETISSPLAPSVTVNSVSPNPAPTMNTVTVTFTISSSLPVTSITVNWGDGTPVDSLTASATSDTHLYTSTGNQLSQSFVITIAASNSAGTGSSSTTEVVSDQIPRVSITSVSPDPASTGSIVTIVFNSTDFDGTITGIAVNWGDGSVIDQLSGTATSDTHVYAATGAVASKTFTIIITVTDNSGSTGSTSTTEIVNDKPPSASVTGLSPNPANTGQIVMVSFSSSDVDGSISSISVNWGDGSPIHNLAGTAASDTHSYTSPGSFTVTIAAIDNSGSTGQATGTVTIVVPTAAPYSLTVTATGQVYKFYQNGTLTLIGQPVTTPLRQVSWKPDGSYALIVGDFAVLLKYDGTSLTTVSTPITSGYNFWSVSWKQDGSYALIGGSVGILLRYDGVSFTQINPGGSTILSIAWHPSGSYAVLAGKTGSLRTYDGTTVRSFTTGTTNDLQTVAWNPNGNYALIGGLNGVVLSFDGTTATTLSTIGLTGTNGVKAIAFNPSGSLAILVGDNGMVLTYNGSTLTLLPNITGSWLYAVAWAPNGTAYIMGGSGTVLTYSNSTLAKLTTSPATTNQYRGIAWKP